MVDKADVLAGTVWTRLGTPTVVEASGTAEEIRRAAGAKKPTLIYFSDEPVVPGSVDLEEYARVVASKKELQGRSLYDSYRNEAELSKKITAHLTQIAREHFAQDTASFAEVTSTSANLPRATLIAEATTEREMTSSSGSGMPRTMDRYNLIIRNEGEAAAENLSFEFTAAESERGGVSETISFSPVNSLAPHGPLRRPLMLHMGSAMQWDVILHWEEDGSTYEDNQTVRT